MEDVFFVENQKERKRRIRVLVIYDIIEDKKRIKVAKFLQGFGYRIQKSAFEAYVMEDVLKKMLRGLEKYVSQEDSIRVYRLSENCRITVYGMKEDIVQGEVLII